MGNIGYTEGIAVPLEQMRQESKGAAERLNPVVHDQLGLVDRSRFHHKRDDHPLQPTALENNHLMRLFATPPTQWRNRPQFFVVASRGMRRTLLGHARVQKPTNAETGHGEFR